VYVFYGPSSLISIATYFYHHCAWLTCSSVLYPSTLHTLFITIICVM